ncbi:uncharacterized protein LOC132200194 isoform X2 [Neocloeon triangulifer]|nr:uncharacterized protein LOC132200194 isoform X2 [Neocloeon triangulifer]
MEREQLIKIAKVKRSIVQNLRPLKELCLEKIRNCASVKTSAVPYKQLSPALRLDILKYLESQGECDKLLCSEMQLWIFELLNRVLDESVREFDFILFSQRRTSDTCRDVQVWKMLTEKCPKLERIADSRKLEKLDVRNAGFIVLGQEANDLRNVSLNPVLPFLLQFPKLEHIELGWYLFHEKSMAIVSETYPNLRTLCCAIRTHTYDLLKSLFSMQKLEILKINWDQYTCLLSLVRVSHKNEMQWDQQRFMKECLKHLPLLRICCSDNTDDTMCHGTIRIDTGDGPFNLETADLECFFDYTRTPFLKNLKLMTPTYFRNHNNVDSLHHLKVLHLHDVRSHFTVPQVLAECGSRLEELTICTSAGPVDPFEVFSLCPRLKKLVFKQLNLTETDQSSALLNESHFSSMETFKCSITTGSFPTQCIDLILLAPNLEHFSLCLYDISSNFHASFPRLLDALVNGRALQKLRTFKFGSCHRSSPELLNFLCLLPIHAPKLKLLKCVPASEELKNQLLDSMLSQISIPDFHFEICE